MPTTSTAKMPSSQDDMDVRLQQLRALLLEEDRIVRENLGEDVNQLKSILLEEDKLDGLLKSHFEGQVKYLQENFPRLFGRYLGEAIKLQIKNSQNEIIDALFPIIGKLISKYLKAELQRISQQIDEKLKNPFSFDNLKLRLKAIFTGVSYHEVLMEEMVRAELKEIFIIDKQSGMLLGHHSIEGIAHPDMVAGMLKGLQDFVEHALETAAEELEFLEYESHTFLLYHLQTVTFAIVVDGDLNATFRTRLQQYVFEFYEKHPVHSGSTSNKAEQEVLAEQLKQHFDGFNQVDQ